MKEYVELDLALSHSFANGHYDHENANEHFILGHESYKEWLETLPVVQFTPVVRCKDCKYGRVLEDNTVKCVIDTEEDEETGVEYGFAAYHDFDFFCANGDSDQDNDRGD